MDDAERAGPAVEDGHDGGVVEDPLPARRSRWWNIALALVAVVVLGVAGALLVTARSASSDASVATAEAASMSQSRDDLDAQQHQLDGRRRAMDAATSDLDSALARLDKAMTDATDAQHHLVDVQSRASSLWNAGNLSGSTNLSKTEGAGALADLDQKTVAVDKALTDVQSAARDLQAKLDG